MDSQGAVQTEFTNLTHIFQTQSLGCIGLDTTGPKKTRKSLFGFWIFQIKCLYL